MPFEHSTEKDSEGASEDRFEADLGEVMRRTGGTFVADRRALLEAGRSAAVARPCVTAPRR